MLWKTRDSYNCDVLAQAAATAALESRDYAQGTWQRVRAERVRLREALVALGFRVLPSQSNFLLAHVPAGKNARALRDGLETHGLLVRYFDAPRIDDALRITVGTNEQSDRLLAALNALLY